MHTHTHTCAGLYTETRAHCFPGSKETTPAALGRAPMGLRWAPAGTGPVAGPKRANLSLKFFRPRPRWTPTAPKSSASWAPVSPRVGPQDRRCVLASSLAHGGGGAACRPAGEEGRGRPRGRAQGQVGVGRDEMRRSFGGKTRGRIHPGTHQPSSFQVLPFSQKARFFFFFL